MDHDTAAGICRSYLESFATGDPQAIAAHVTDGFVNDHASALGSGLVGKAAYLERLPGVPRRRMPGLRYDAEEPIVDGARVAAPYTLHATATDPRGDERADHDPGRDAHRTWREN